MDLNKIYHGNNLDILRTFDDNSVDSIVTDPPYGLGKEPNALEVLQSWITTGYHEIKGKGFMGKEWDAFVPQPVFWKECLRVLKPGGHLLSFAGTRTYDWVVMGLRIAGFEIRDLIAWVYASGFPKSMNIEKAIEGQLVNGTSNKKDFSKLSGERLDRGDWGITKMTKEQGFRDKDYTHETKQTDRLGKLEATTPEAKQWQGWGTALKPSQETICVARKPIENSSIIMYNDIKEVALCLLKSFVQIVGKSFTLNQKEQDVVQNIVQWIAEKNISIEVDLQEAMDMLQSLKMENINLNIVLSWLNILAEIYELKNTSTTEMVLSMIIELKTLKLLEWENILKNIIQAKDNKTSGIQQNVLLVEKNFKDLKTKRDYILTHFVQENATSLGKSKNLSPNYEPIVMARKPLDGTVAQNILKHGVGGINIDGCRVELNGEDISVYRENETKLDTQNQGWGFRAVSRDNKGRFPANFIHDGSDEVVKLFPNTEQGVASDYNWDNSNNDNITHIANNIKSGVHYGDSGSAARFFYTPKASQTERNWGLGEFDEDVTTDGRTKPIDNAFNRGETKRKNIHPTVKPIDLMRYLVRLVTPKNGICLDPYMGSGTTAIACKAEKINYVGCELDEEYIKISEARIKAEVVVYDIFDFGA